MDTLLDKDPAILDVLERLRARLGSDAFIIVDHWESDLCAVGIANPHNLGVLVYISSYGEPPERFGYELESPPPVGSESLYEVVGRGFGVSSDELAIIAAEHLNLSQASDRSPYSRR